MSSEALRKQVYIFTTIHFLYGALIIVCICLLLGLQIVHWQVGCCIRRHGGLQIQHCGGQ